VVVIEYPKMLQNVFSDKKYSGGCISDFRILIMSE